jgi:hypothetical protein
MALLNFSCEVHELQSRAPSDPDAAAELLLLAAKYLRNRTPLTDDLADYLAGAIEASMRKPEPHRLNALGTELFLTTPNRRPAADWLEVGRQFDNIVDPFDPSSTPAQSQNSAAAQIAADFGISEATAARYWKAYKAALEEHDRIMREEARD